MTSKVTSVRTALNGLMSTYLPAYEKLSDSYDAPDNPSLTLEKGYSIGFGPAQNISADWCAGSVIMQRRQFMLILTNVYTPNLDPDRREQLENDLLDDEFTINAALERDVTLGGVAITSRYLFDNGLEYLIADRKQYIIIVVTIQVDYEENT